MAKRYWPKGNALGAHIHSGPDPNAPWIGDRGVVGNVRNDPAQPAPEPMITRRADSSRSANVSFIVRTTGDPLALARRRCERTAAASIAGLADAQRHDDEALLADGFAARRLPVVLMTAFGALALLLASVGVYAMFASMAAAREREFGVRVALGSSAAGLRGSCCGRARCGWRSDSRSASSACCSSER